MKKFILQRGLKKMERREIEAETWDDAVKLLEKFQDEPIPDDCILIPSFSQIEYIGGMGKE